MHDAYNVVSDANLKMRSLGSAVGAHHDCLNPIFLSSLSLKLLNQFLRVLCFTVWLRMKEIYKFIKTYLMTSTMELCSYWRQCILLDNSTIITPLMWTRIPHSRGSPSIRVLNRISPICTNDIYFYKIHSDIVLPSTLSSS